MLAGSLGSVSCGVTAPILWVFVHAKFCLCPPKLESLLPPVLWKSYNQILLALEARFPWDSQSVCQIPRLGSLTWCSEPSQQCKKFFSITVLQSVSHPPASMGFDFIMIVPLLPSCCGFFFVFGLRLSFFGGFQHPPVDSCSIASCNFGALTGGDERTYFYSAILSPKWIIYFLFEY